MGIRGLGACMGRDLRLHENYRLYGTKVVIDGGNFLYWFYQNSEIDFIHGGDYNRIFETAVGYITMLEECRIEPIFIFDGSNENYEWRFLKAKKSTEKRLESCKNIFNGNDKKFLMPLLAWEVFQDVLDERNIKYARCVYDADSHTAALSNYFQCPVISGDNDFYIFDVQFGFIRLESISDIQLMDGIKYLNCNIFYRNKLLSLFPRLDFAILPLFATLLGNDVVNEDVFYEFCRRNIKFTNRSSKIISLLHWLEGQSLDRALEQVISSFTVNDRNSVKSIILQSIHEYNNGDIILASVLKEDPAKKSLPQSFKICTPSNNPLPMWFCKKHVMSKVDSIFLNIINLRKIFLPIQVENIKKSSTFYCCLEVRKIIYAICFLFENKLNEESASTFEIIEYDRRDNDLNISIVNPTFYIPQYGAVPSLSDIPSMSQENRENFFFAVLGIRDKKFLDAFPQNWKYFSAVVVYWMKWSSPSEEFLNALLACVILLAVVEKKTCKRTNLNVDCPAENKNIRIRKLIDQVSMDEAKSTWSKFKKYFNNTSKFERHGGSNPDFINTVHCYSQLQGCLLFIGYISQIVDVYFDFRMFRCLNGTFLYNFIRESKTMKDRNVLLSVKFSSLLANLHTEIKTIYKKAVEVNCA